MSPFYKATLNALRAEKKMEIHKQNKRGKWQLWDCNGGTETAKIYK